MNTLIKNLTILYIENEDDTREFVTNTLRLMSDNVLSVSTVVEAKKLYDTQSIDVIISDIIVGEESGLSLVKEIRSQDKLIPVILLTANFDREYLLEAITLNLIEYMMKPASYESLKNTLMQSAKNILENGKIEIEFSNGVKFNLKRKTAFDFDNNKVIYFTVTELKLLEFLIKNKNDILNAEDIKHQIWEDQHPTEGALKSLISKLRTKIGKDTIKNYSGLGYKLIYKESLV